MVGHRAERQVVPEVPALADVRAEGQRAHPGVHPVRADHQVEPPLEPAGETHRHPARALGQPRDPVPEQVFGRILGGPVEHLRQVAAQDLDLGDEPVTVQQVGAHGDDRPVAPRDVGDAGGLGARRAHLGVQAHPTQHVLGDARRSTA